MENFKPQGWQCPSCKHVMSPSMSFCLFCPATVTTSDSTLTKASIHKVEQANKESAGSRRFKKVNVR